MFTMTSTAPQAGLSLERLARQVPFATANALTQTALAVREDLKAHMVKVFDRPTPFTLNAFMVVPAVKSDGGNMVAEVKTKPLLAKRHFLDVEERGGVRPQTALERLLGQQLAVPWIVQTAVPADGASLDAYGNFSGGMRNRMLSALKAQRDPAANRTARSGQRNKANRGVTYFAPRHGLSPGIYRRQGRNISIVLKITAKRADYTPRLNFAEVAPQFALRHFPVKFSAALAAAMASAR